MKNEYLYRAKKQITDPQILSIVAARRARQLANGARPMIKTDDQEYLDIALLEIAEGLLGYEFPTEEEIAAAKQAARDAEALEAEADALAEQVQDTE
ncbi:MAG: DNA-directed RNA polymerase subunit omega [Lentisphaeria bacterium]|jgi:DNA-directed RNA polymerase subunit omega|nr:DNA-directed RNA polymerase subunit omega [Lentisphaeria bacterium]